MFVFAFNHSFPLQCQTRTDCLSHTFVCPPLIGPRFPFPFLNVIPSGFNCEVPTWPRANNSAPQEQLVAIYARCLFYCRTSDYHCEAFLVRAARPSPSSHWIKLTEGCVGADQHR